MDNMNFLHKKYTSSFNQSLSHSRSSRSFLPPQNSSIPRQTPSHPHSVAQTQNINTNPQQNLLSNHCATHPQQLIRHMCTDCIQLLCSECIGEHIAVHKQGNSFPTISTLKQMKQEMNMKLSQMTHFMMTEYNHPKCINIDSIRKQSNLKIDQVRKEMLAMVQDWILRLRNSVINNVGYEELTMIKKEMSALQEQVQMLNNSLINANTSVQAIKKAYQIDGQKLYKSYKSMVDKYYSVKGSLELQIQINQTKFMESLQSCVFLKAGERQIIKVENQQDNEDYIEEDNSKIDLPLQLNSPYQKLQQKQKQLTQCLGLFDLPPGSSILSHQNVQENHAFSKINTYNINTKTYPLNSSCLLPENMIIISGGMISESKKNNTIQIYDYAQGTIITKAQLKYSRSSHSTIPYKDKIFFIGGFTHQGQCQSTQLLTGQGIFESPNLCKWGGPNLCALTSEGILKITLSGVQMMNLQTLQWKQLKSDVPFSIGKGMSIQYLLLKSAAYVFGDQREFYEWNCDENKFIIHQSNIQIGNIKSSSVKDGLIYCWNEQKNVLSFDGKEWRIIKNDNV